MASDTGSSKDVMDERLAQARDAALFDCEEIVAQETGDQGQAIVITNNRILIIKSGLTATGVLNGSSVGSFAFEKITAVNLRKGPIGAVIQICTDTPPQAAPGGTPDNIIVFSGDQRIKKCDGIAGKIESALGKQVERFEPKIVEQKQEPADSIPSPSEAVVEEKPKRMKGGREAKSLAEEMFEDMASSEVEQTKSEPVAAEPVEIPEQVDASSVEEVEKTSEPAPVEMVIEEEAELEPIDIPAVEEIVEEPQTETPEAAKTRVEAESIIETELTDSFRPNPNLPKPVKKKPSSKRSFLLVGGLMVLALLGMAVTSPLRNPKPLPKVEINVEKLTRNGNAVRKQLTEVQDYRSQVVDILAASDKEAASLSAAVHSGRQSIVSAAGKNASYKAWQNLNKLKVPSGLAGAKENLMLGLFTRKNAVANALSVGPVDASSINSRLRESNILIKKGLNSIDKMEEDLNTQLNSTQQKTEKQKSHSQPANNN